MTGSSTQGIAVLHPASDLAAAKASDVGGGRLVATVADPDGNVLGLIPGQTSADPPLPTGSNLATPGSWAEAR